MHGRGSKFRLTFEELGLYALDTNPRQGCFQDGFGSVSISPKGSRLSGRYEIHSPRAGLNVLVFDLLVDTETELVVTSDRATVGFVMALEGKSRRSITTGSGRTVNLPVNAGTSMIGTCQADESRFSLMRGSFHRLVKIQCDRTLLAEMMDDFGSEVPEHLSTMLSPPGPAGAVVCMELSPALQSIAHQLIRCPLVGAPRRLFFEAKALETIALQVADSTQVGPHGGLLYDDQTVERLYHARRILDREFVDPPTLGSLARRCGLNEFKLKRGFREVFQTTVYGYVRGLRMEKARMLLEDGRLNVTEVALESGYSSLGHFAAAFKKHFGVVPREYRSGIRSTAQADAGMGTEPAS